MENKLKETVVVFEGMFARDEDGTKVPIPGNYISKSKLIPGDRLIMRISPATGIYYKQVYYSEMKYEMAVVSCEYQVKSSFGREYRVHPSSYTFYHLKEGDRVMIKIRKDGEGEYCAIEGKIEE